MGRKQRVSPTVLVVDDEEFDRTSATKILEAEGYNVLQAESYSDAMAVFDANRDAVTLLLADVALPDGNGCALAIAIRKQNPAVRVLFVSGHVGAEICKYYGLEVDAIHFLRKPFEGSELAARIRTILTSKLAFPSLLAPRTSSSSSTLG